MAQRIKLGIPFHYNVGWIAYAYYISNLISGLNRLSDEKKPRIIIYLVNDEALSLLKDIGYPYISFKKRNPFFIRLFNKLSRSVFKKNLFGKLPANKIDILFPASDDYFFQQIPLKNKIYWIPDFQEHFLASYFTKEEIKTRKDQQQTLVEKNVKILFSSNSAQTDFFTIYPNAQNNTYVLPFAVSHTEEYKKIDISSLSGKFNLPDEYYFCANQFWAHKNHITILKALALLKQKNKNVSVVFSGNQRDYRNPHFFESLMQYVSDNKLESNTRFLGFIDRNEQLTVMKNSKAIIQPSLFEGWSTVVEDAKSLNKSLILSDIPIHREQVNSNVKFFDPLNDVLLAEILENYLPETTISDYSKNINIFAETVYSILNKAIR